MSSNLTREQYYELLFNQDCSLLTIEHLDVYHIRHWTPEQFFARKDGNMISELLDGYEEAAIFIVLLARGIDLKMINDITEADIATGTRVVVSFRRAIGDRIGYAFVSIQKRKSALNTRPKASLPIGMHLYDNQQGWDQL